MMNEREKYERMYDIEEYRQSSPGASMVGGFMDKHLRGKSTVSIYGCGPGRCGLKLYNAGHTVRMIDIAYNALDNRVREHLSAPEFEFYCTNLVNMDRVPVSQYGFCVDVMEHIPTHQVGDVLQMIRMKTERLVYFHISGRPDGCGKLIGETLHMTVKSADWWDGALNCFWKKIKRITFGQEAYLFTAEA